jgi:hypothetical protein
MLRFGIKIKDRREIIGQIPRLLVGGVKSFVGKIPVGNTGGANVPGAAKEVLSVLYRSIADRQNFPIVRAGLHHGSALYGRQKSREGKKLFPRTAFAQSIWRIKCFGENSDTGSRW